MNITLGITAMVSATSYYACRITSARAFFGYSVLQRNKFISICVLISFSHYNFYLKPSTILYISTTKNVQIQEGIKLTDGRLIQKENYIFACKATSHGQSPQNTSLGHMVKWKLLFIQHNNDFILKVRIT